ncbi:MAG: NAD(P)/FAD-dependent oxidoreductase, partial [Nocardioides sp.]|nr:NAD(P)/FAD-dependent oxidoreductase [Nocardioides sp.]
LLDRADFPRDKACGDGVAPHVLDLLARVGVTGLLDDRVPVPRLRLTLGDQQVERRMSRPAYVVPRLVLDARLVDAACAAGAQLVRHRVREVRVGADGVVLDGEIDAAVVVGADGAHSGVRRGLGVATGRTAFALRGYAPVPTGRAGAQVITFGTTRQPSYAWSFDCGDGQANVGYGEVLGHSAAPPSRRLLLDRLEQLLPGSTRGGTDWVGHHLPLSGPRWRPPSGRVLLVGDAAGLVNPLTGEGIYYAVATGLEAGRAAARAVGAGEPASAGHRYVRAARAHLFPHLRHTAAAARLSLHGPVLAAGIEASARDQRVFDDLVDLGLARGRITPTMARGLVGALARRRSGAEDPPGTREMS